MTAYEMRTSDWSSDVCSSDLNCPESSWRSSDDRDRRGREDARNVSRRPRSPINRVLEHAGNTVVVFRGRKQQPIGLGNCFLQVSHGLRYSLFFLDIGAIERRSEEHTSELQSLMRISYAVFCLKKKIHYTILSRITKQKTAKLHYNTRNINT